MIHSANAKTTKYKKKRNEKRTSVTIIETCANTILDETQTHS